MAEIKRCKEPFAGDIDGMTRVVAAGQLVSTDDPAYSKGTAEHFEAVAFHVAEQESRRARASGVESATAVPGEKRSLLGRLRGSSQDEAGSDAAEAGEPDEGAETETAEGLPRPKGNGTTEDWAAYAAARGVEVPEDANRDAIKAAVEAADAADES